MTYPATKWESRNRGAAAPWGLLAAGIALILVALIAFVVTGMVWGRMGRWNQNERAEFRSNGERIYFTATSDSGDRITFTGGPHWFRMHGGSCVTCHGPAGRGGARLPMTHDIAPDIRFRVLSTEEHEEGHRPFNEELVKRAITKGLEPDGHELSATMPRWQMTERDLDDLLEYLKTL